MTIDDRFFAALRHDTWRVVVWLRSCLHEWMRLSSRMYERDALRTMSLQADLASGLLDASGEMEPNAAAAFALSRPAFEAGLKCHWLIAGTSGPDQPASLEEVELRHYALLLKDADWIGKVAVLMAEGGIGGQRWAVESKRLHCVLAAYVERNPVVQEKKPPQMPPVRNLLKDLGLLRLYHSYMISSEWVHAGRMAGREFDPFRAIRAGHVDVTMAFGQVIWGATLATHAYARRPGGEGRASLDGSPLGDAQEALDFAWTAAALADEEA